MKDIGDVLPTPEMLEGDQVEKEELVDKVLTIKDFVLLPSSYEGQDNFAVVQADVGNKTVTFSGGQVITKKLTSIGRDSLPIKCKLVKTKGKRGRQYFDLVSTKPKEKEKEKE